jgi:LacI family transcriptional regulator
MTVTIRDVAVRAGVSVATVSRALNRSGPVREDTRQRIEAAASELNYRPNSAARSLITRRTRMLGVLLPDLHGEFFSELIRGIDQAAQARGYHLLLSSSHDNATDLERALQGMHARVDGLVVMAPMVEATVIQALLPRNVPVVLLNSADGGRAHASMRIDSHGGARAAVAHLVGHGHRRIGAIAGPAQNFDADERLRGYLAALEEPGIEADAALQVRGDFSGSAGYEAAERLLRLADPPTAIFAANDAMAIGALSALRAADVAVPDGMALIGFDDVPSTQYTIPPLTSVRGEIGDLAGGAVAAVAEALSARGPRTTDQTTVPTTRVLRRSSGCGASEREAGWERAAVVTHEIHTTR